MNNLPAEVASAVERLVKGAYEYIDAPWLKSTDEKAIVRHFLSTLTAQSERDAAEVMPVDEAWLRSIGFADDGFEFSLRNHETGYEVAYRENGDDFKWYYIDRPINPPKTRGDVLRLLAALNITPGGAE